MAKRQEALKRQYDVLCEKLDRLRQAHAIETDDAKRFRLEKQILLVEKELDELERQLNDVQNSEHIKQKSKGKQSPNIVSKGDVTINYGS